MAGSRYNVYGLQTNQPGRKELDLREEVNRLLYGASDEIAKGRDGLLRQMKRNNAGKLIRCSCRDTVTDEPDRDYYCRTCVLPTAMIPTKQGIRQAKEIVPGMKVLAGDGSFKEVTNVYAKLYSGTMVSLYTCGRTNMPLTTTADHKIFVLKNVQACHWKKAFGKICCPELCCVPSCKIKTQNPAGFDVELVERRADKIIEGDYVAIPQAQLCREYNNKLFVDWSKYQASRGIQAFEPPNEIDIDEDLMFFLGWYVAEGSGGHTGRKTRSVHFALHRDKERAIADELLRIAREKFCLKGVIKASKDPQKKSLQVKFDNAVLSRWLHELCGRYADCKCIPQFVWSLPEFLQRAFLVNFMLGDGHRDNQNWETAGITSRILAEEIYIMAVSLGFYPTISFQEAYKGSDGQAHADSWYIMWLDSQQKASTKQLSKWRRRFKTGGYIFSRVEKITHKEDVAAVYDFTVAQEHSFVADGVLVHNCLGMGWLFQETKIVYYKREESFRKREGKVQEYQATDFYLEYDETIYNEDWIIEVKLDVAGSVVLPPVREKYWEILSADAFRADDGRVEFWRIRAAERRNWSTWYGVDHRQYS